MVIGIILLVVVVLERSSQRASENRPRPTAVLPTPSIPSISVPSLSGVPGEHSPSGSQSQQCATYVIVTVRGTGEQDDGDQLLSPVANQIMGELDEVAPEATYVSLDYPASFDLRRSAEQGIGALVQLLTEQAQACPGQRFVLLGYSQGAMVVTDALISPESRRWGQDVAALPSEAAQRVDAVVLYGDLGFAGSEPFNAGDYDPSRSGTMARPQGSLDAYASRIRSFCVRDDFFCQSGGGGSLRGHLEYFSNGMREQGAEFALEAVAARRSAAASG
ncbi:MAG: cutinase family protein [Actinomycetaceae bacterium]|nr:cutinase family protein [Actinomycetaceae bacterium]